MPSWNTNNKRPSGPGIKKSLAIGGAVLALALLAGAFGLAQQKERELATLDPDTFCPKTGPLSELAVLIDRTDGLTEMQAADLEGRILAWADAVPKHGAFRIYEVGRGGRLLEPVVAVCNPGDGSDQSSTTSNPKMWRARYERKYIGPIQSMLEGMQVDEEASRSPIMEAVQAIAVRDFGPGTSTDVKEIKLVTDLLQYTDGLNLYKGAPPFEQFWKGPYAGSVRTDLTGVSIEIFLLNRAKAAGKQTDGLGAFWLRWLQEQGAVVEFKHIAG